jgi:hypothetical protein
MQERERQDLERLRGVHILRDEKNIRSGAAWPHHRKIVDKFPNIPTSLAQRLADSNVSKDGRLRKARHELQALEDEERLKLSPVNPP